MDTPEHNKRGRKPFRYEKAKTTLVLPKDLWDWATSQEDGGASLVRRLLTEERRRREREANQGLVKILPVD
jgi:hypothetical protein